MQQNAIFLQRDRCPPPPHTAKQTAARGAHRPPAARGDGRLGSGGQRLLQPGLCGVPPGAGMGLLGQRHEPQLQGSGAGAVCWPTSSFTPAANWRRCCCAPCGSACCPSSPAGTGYAPSSGTSSEPSPGWSAPPAAGGSTGCTALPFNWSERGAHPEPLPNQEGARLNPPRRDAHRPEGPKTPLPPAARPLRNGHQRRPRRMGRGKGAGRSL